MARERGHKKSFQQSLDDIKEKMKEKRNKRLASASAPRGRLARRTNKTNGSNSNHAILKGVQENNKCLALAVQAEKEKLRQANGVILQLKREQQALFLHLLLLKRRLKEQEAMAKKVRGWRPGGVLGEQTRITSDKSPLPEDPSLSQGPVSPENTGESEVGARIVPLPSTVGVRRRRAESCSRRRSERTSERRRSFSVAGGSVDTMVGSMLAEVGVLTASPIPGDCSAQKRKSTQRGGVAAGPVDPIGSDEIQHSTPEPAPAKSTNQPKPRRKHTQQQQQQQKQQQQPRVKPEPAARKPERGRKVERGPLKKPWENPKPTRTRSKSRDRSATRGRPPASRQADPLNTSLNTSLGFNDTFDFDCEEAVHLTPFKAKAEEAAAAHKDVEVQSPPTAKRARAPVASPPSSPSSSESEGELYVPQKSRRRLRSPGERRTLPGRRGRRATRGVPDKENLPTQQEVSVLRDKDTENKAVVHESEEPPCPESPDWMFTSSPAPTKANQESPLELQRPDVLAVTPGMEAEMMRIDSVLSRDSSSDTTPPVLPSKPPRKTTNMCKKRGFGVRAAGRGLSLCDVTNMSPAAYCKVPGAGSRPSEGRCATPVAGRKRRCTMTVDYKEPSLIKKLRRGDKFTDLQFLRSPVFKPSPGARRSVQGDRTSRKSQQPLHKYNESFVGCR
ncbi:Shugoshin 1 [Merluccius polli]|uniref:Shugoshin 1 n=1 Tax=Merluccius polli TaxID=89951 RepID=A0AA47P0J5_MERPO|nr:Shugoshin 1 [Merluccius polli]